MMTAPMDYPIEELELKVRPYNILKRAGCHTFEDVLNITLEDVNSWCGRDWYIGLLGFKQLAEVQDQIRSLTQ